MASPAMAASSDRLEIRLGRSLFERNWVSAPASTRASDGLGPLANARSCAACHGDGRRLPATAPLVLRLGVPGEEVDAHPVYGRQLQEHGVRGVPAEGRLELRFDTRPVTLADGAVVVLRRPVPEPAELGYGPLGDATLTSLRAPPRLVSLAVIDAVPEAVLVNAAAAPGRDGISGRVARVWDPLLGRPVAGRFGWKASQPNLAVQNALAMALDIGLSSELFPDPRGDCTEAQTACQNAPAGAPDLAGAVEAAPAVLTAILTYTRSLQVPPAASMAPVQALGRDLFSELGCAACHTPVPPLLDGAMPLPHTDLLLHDMGPGLADGLAEGGASGSEWRTAPLAGLGRAVTGGPVRLLHDGRAASLLEAILWHAGEALPARDRVVHLAPAERAALLAYLETL